jgi:hypothetical protein
MAFTLPPREILDPLYTIRRIIVSGTSSTEGMIRSMESSLINRNSKFSELDYYFLKKNLGYN